MCTRTGTEPNRESAFSNCHVVTSSGCNASYATFLSGCSSLRCRGNASYATFLSGCSSLRCRGITPHPPLYHDFTTQSAQCGNATLSHKVCYLLRVSPGTIVVLIGTVALVF